MSHFSKVKTRINDLNILTKSLIDLGFNCNSQQKYLDDMNNNKQYVDLVAIHQMSSISIGFMHDHDHYNIVTDMDLWKTGISFDFFVEQLHQNYALNIILKQTNIEGFNKITQDNLVDGSIKLTVQRWN